MATPPKTLKKPFYSRSEVLELLGITLSQLRFWEHQCNLPPATKNKQGHYRYTAQQISILQRIQALTQGAGYTLRGAKRALHPARHPEALIQHLKQVRQWLVQLEATLAQSTPLTHEHKE